MLETRTVKSQDDTRAKQDTRSSDVLIHALEKCEALEKINAKLIQTNAELGKKICKLDRENKKLKESGMTALEQFRFNSLIKELKQENQKLKYRLSLADASKTIDHIGDTTEMDHICQEGKMVESYMQGVKDGQETTDMDYKIICLENENEELDQRVKELERENIHVYGIERERKQLQEKIEKIKDLIHDVYDPGSIDGRTVMAIRELFEEYK